MHFDRGGEKILPTHASTYLFLAQLSVKQHKYPLLSFSLRIYADCQDSCVHCYKLPRSPNRIEIVNTPLRLGFGKQGNWEFIHLLLLLRHTQYLYSVETQSLSQLSQ